MSARTRRPPGRSTRAASLIAFARATGVGMLCTTRLLTITSTLLSSNGSSVMSAVRTSTRSATPSVSALRNVLCCELSVWSARQMSTPMALPFGNSLAAASRTAPRPQPQTLEDFGPHFELAHSCGPNEQRRGRHNERTRSAGHGGGGDDGLTAHQASGRRRQQCRAYGPDDGRHGRRGHRAVIPVEPVIGLVSTKVYDSHSFTVGRPGAVLGPTSRTAGLRRERLVEDLLLLDRVHLRRPRRRSRHRATRDPLDA